MHNKIHLTSADVGKRVLLRNGETAVAVKSDDSGDLLFSVALRLPSGSLISVTPEGAYWHACEEAYDVVEMLDRPFTITPNDVGRTVRLRNGKTAKVTGLCQSSYLYPVLLDSGRSLTYSGDLIYGTTNPDDAVAFVDGPADPRAANAAKAVGRFLAIESGRNDGILVSSGLNIRRAFDTREEAEAFIRDDVTECWGDGGAGAGSPENFSGDWFIAEITRAVRPVLSVNTETDCRLDTLAEKE